MAEELFPAHASEQVHAIQLGKKFGGMWLKKARKRMETKSRRLGRFLGSSKDLSKSMTGSGDGESGPASPKKSPDKKGHASLTKSVQSPRTPPDDDDDPGAMLTRTRSSSNRNISFKADDGADDGALARQSPRSPPSSSSTGDDGGGLARTSSKSSLVSSRSSSMRGAQTPAPQSQPAELTCTCCSVVRVSNPWTRPAEVPHRPGRGPWCPRTLDCQPADDSKMWGSRPCLPSSQRQRLPS